MEQFSENPNVEKYKRNRILTGLILVGIGIVLFADKMGVMFPHWLLTWPVLLIVIGIYKGIKDNFRNFTWLILVLVGSLFLWDNFVDGVDLKRFIVPIILIAVGLIRILKPKPHWKYNREQWREKWAKHHPAAFDKAWEDSDPLSDDFINIKSVFSGMKRSVLSKNFKGGKISCVFGGVELDLSKADIQETAVLRMEEVFGGIKLVVPSNWSVKNDIEGVFHGVEDKRNYQVQGDANKVLVLQGSAVFAGIEISSY